MFGKKPVFLGQKPVFSQNERYRRDQRDELSASTNFHVNPSNLKNRPRNRFCRSKTGFLGNHYRIRNQRLRIVQHTEFGRNQRQKCSRPD